VLKGRQAQAYKKFRDQGHSVPCAYDLASYNLSEEESDCNCSLRSVPYAAEKKGEKYRVEEAAARDWEQKGFIVIRPFSMGCPDLIIIDPKGAGYVKAREIKQWGKKKDYPRHAQRKEIERLRMLNIDADFQKYDPDERH
jgi:hypothetical protein